MVTTNLKALLNGISELNFEDIKINSIVTDSREVIKNSLFIAIKGENFDGHEYIEDAFQKGAYAVVAEYGYNKQNLNIIEVEDTKDTYILIAKNYKEQFDLLSVGITGSVGKTTTKEMTATIFESIGNTLKNEGNLNNEIGLPKTMLEIAKETEYAIFEMGMNKSGDIRKLANAVKPKAAIITGIGLAHIEYLKTRENILQAKLEIVEGMPKDGILVINGDDELLMGVKESIPIKTVTFAIDNSDADVYVKDVLTRRNSCEFVIVDKIYGNIEVNLPAVGNHYIMDALSAYALTTRLGVKAKVAAESLSNYRPTGMRQNVVEYNGITVIEDCYNANPDSMKAALNVLSVLPVNGVRIAVLGDMLELGEYTKSEHKNLGIYAANCGIDILLCIGENMKETVESAKASKIASVEWFENKEDLVNYLIKTVNEGDAVIFKASRSMKLEEAIELFYIKKK